LVTNILDANRHTAVQWRRYSGEQIAYSLWFVFWMWVWTQEIERG